MERPASPVESTPVAGSEPTQPLLDSKQGDSKSGRAQSRWARGVGMLRPSHAHSTFSATIVLMVSTFLSRIIGLVRVQYIVWLFGRGMEADALNAAFVLPDMISYFLVGAIVLAEIFAPLYIHWWFNGFDPQKAALCVRLTRILLPAQLFFFAGGLFAAVLLVRKQFSVQ